MIILVSILSVAISLLAVILLWNKSNSKFVVVVSGIILCIYFFGAFWNGSLVSENSQNYEALALSGMIKDIFGTIEIPLIFAVLFSSLEKKS